MEMVAETSALLRIFGYAKSQVLLKDSVDITVRLNAAIISSKLVRTVTPPAFGFCSSMCRFVVCGDGERNQASEQCDNPDPAICNTNCRFPTCGDGEVNPANEDCDDTDRSICNSNCKFPLCGDG